MYTRQTVTALLPAVWDPMAAYGVKQEGRPDEDMPTARGNPAHGGGLMAMIADLRLAWWWASHGGLEYDEAAAVLLACGAGFTHEEVAEHIGSHRRRVGRLVERGIGKMTAHLNGAAYVDGYDALPEQALAA